MSTISCPVMMTIFHFMYLFGFTMKQKQIGKEWIRTGTHWKTNNFRKSLISNIKDRIFRNVFYSLFKGCHLAILWNTFMLILVPPLHANLITVFNLTKWFYVVIWCMRLKNQKSNDYYQSQTFWDFLCFSTVFVYY